MQSPPFVANFKEFVMKQFLKIALLLLFAVTLAACDQQKTTTPTKIDPSGYPMPTAYQPYPAPNSGYPAPVDPKPTQAPTLDKSKAVVKGVLLLNGKPVKLQNLYLGGVLTDAKGKEIVASMNQQKDPNALTNSLGEFTFVNVPPGRYAVILDNATTAALLLNPKGSEAILLTLKAGDTIDLGKLDYQDLPIPKP